MPSSGPLTLQGAPIASIPSGIWVPGVTRAPAAIMARAPILAPSSTVLLLPTSASSPMSAPWIRQRCATVAPGPTSTPLTGVTWITAQSWMFAPRRMTMGEKSARTTALYQTEAFSSTVTSPTIVAVGAMNAEGWMRGDLPSNE